MGVFSISKMSPLPRTLAVGAVEVLLALATAVINPAFLLENAYWLAPLAILALVVAALWDQFLEFWRWKRGDKRILYLESKMERLPERLPGQGALTTHVLWVHGQQATLGWHTSPYSEERPLDWGQEQPPYGVRLSVTNYSDETLLHVKLIFEASVRENVKSEGRTASGEEVASGDVVVRIDRLPPGEDRAVTTYIRNESPHYANLSLKAAYATPLGGKSAEVPIETNAYGNVAALWPAERYA